MCAATKWGVCKGCWRESHFIFRTTSGKKVYAHTSLAFAHRIATGDADIPDAGERAARIFDNMGGDPEQERRAKLARVFKYTGDAPLDVLVDALSASVRRTIYRALRSASYMSEHNATARANSEDLLYFCHNRRTDGSTIVVKTSKMVCTLENAEAFWKQALADFKNTSSSIAHGIEDFYVYGETHYDLHELPTANAHSDECWLVYKHEDMKRVDIADFGSWSSFIIEGQTSFYDIEIPLDWKQWTKK